MKKISFVSFLSLLFLSCCSMLEVLFRRVPFANAWIPLIIGGVLLLASGVVAIVIRRKLWANILCYAINAIALGLCIRSWYIFRNFDNGLWIMLLVSLSCVVYLFVFYLLLYIPFIERHFNVYIWVFLGVTFVGYLIVMFTSKTTFVSTFGYYAIVETAFMFAMCKKQDSTAQLFRDVVVSTYSVLIVAVIIALLMLECDSLDAFDVGGSTMDISSPKNKRVNL